MLVPAYPPSMQLDPADTEFPNTSAAALPTMMQFEMLIELVLPRTPPAGLGPPPTPPKVLPNTVQPRIVNWPVEEIPEDKGPGLLQHWVA